MRSFQVFAAMTPEQATQLLRGLSKAAPGIAAQAIGAAAVAMKARPVYFKRQPIEKRAQSVRRALSRVASEPIAAEVLATYFLECRNELLVEWLDALGLAHDEGVLSDDAPPEPGKAELTQAIDAFLAQGDDDVDRPLLLAAFAAQEAIAWPGLEARVDASG
ncbi:MAG: hypothetical protein VX546_06530 [Myxococcota bacterium]|nr:hypothetical protein [Myxococcota bacterium]